MENNELTGLEKFKKRLAEIFGDQTLDVIFNNNICVSDRVVRDGNILNLLTVGDVIKRINKLRYGHNPNTNDVLIYKGGIYNMSQLNLWVITDALKDFDEDMLLSSIPDYEFEGV